MQTTITQSFDRNPLFPSKEKSADPTSLVLIEAGAPYRVLMVKKESEVRGNGNPDRTLLLVQAQVTPEPGDVAFAWLPKDRI
jgi:hypothetical protein